MRSSKTSRPTRKRGGCSSSPCLALSPSALRSCRPTADPCPACFPWRQREAKTQMERHLVRSVGLTQVDEILKVSALQAFNIGQDLGDEVNDLTKTVRALTDKERLVLAKALPKDIATEAANLVNTIQKKNFADAVAMLEDCFSDFCGKRVPKMDKKLEHKVLREYQQELLASLNSNAALTSTIAIAVPLLLAKKKDLMVNLPGKLLGFAITQLEGAVDEAEYETLCELHKKTVSYIQKSSRKGTDAHQVAELEVELGTLSASVTSKVSAMILPAAP